MNQNSQLDIFASLSANIERPLISWTNDLSDVKFDPENGSVTLPIVGSDIYEYMQRGYILANLAPVFSSTPELWKRAQGEDISLFVYNFVSQIRGERRLRRKFPGGNHDLARFYDTLRKERILKVGPKSTLFERIFYFEKVPYLENTSMFPGTEKNIIHAVQDMKTDDEFIAVCKMIEQNYNSRDHIRSAAQGSTMTHDQQYVESLAAKIHGMVGAKHKTEIKNFNPYTYFDVVMDNNFMSFKESIKLNETAFVQQNFKDARIDKILATLKGRAEELCREFSTRKSAISYRDAHGFDENELDPDRMWAHRIEKNLFMAGLEEQEGQSHGMILMLDFSSSMMGGKIKLCIEQTIMLSMFLRMCSIPHRILAFSDGDPTNEELPMGKEHSVWPSKNFHIYELFSNEMTEEQFAKMQKILSVMYLTARTRGDIVTEFTFGKTPLLNALMVAPVMIREFTEAYKIERLMVMVLSDGQTHPLTFMKSGEIIERDAEFLGSVKIFDEVTLKMFDEKEGAILMMFKDYFGDSVEFVNVVPGAKVADLHLFEWFQKHAGADAKIDEFRRTGVAIVDGTNYDKVVYMKDHTTLEGLNTSDNVVVRTFINRGFVNSLSKAFGRVFIDSFY